MLSRMKSSWTNVSTQRPLASDRVPAPLALRVGVAEPSRERSRSPSELDEGNLLHPSGERETEGEVPAKLSLTALPEDIIVAILCYTMTPWDLVSISHTSRLLRSCSFAPIVWIHAWRRNQDALPNLSPPKFVPPTNPSHWIPINALSPNSTGHPTKSHRLDRLSGEWDGESTGDLRARFLRTIRAKYQLSQPEAIVQPVVVALEPCPFSEYIDMTMTSGGEVLVIWTRKDIRLVDLRNGALYTVHCPPISLYAYPTVVVAEIVEVEGEQGVLLAGPFRGDGSITIAFQPLVLDLERDVDPAPLRCLGAIPLRENSRLSAILISRRGGIYLTVGDIIGQTTCLRIIDLTNGRTFLVMTQVYPTGIRRVEVCGDKIILFGPSEYLAPFHVFDASEIDPPYNSDQTSYVSPEVMCLFLPSSVNPGICYPHTLHTDTTSGRSKFSLWFTGRVYAQNLDGISLMQISAPFTDNIVHRDLYFSGVASWVGFRRQVLPFAGRAKPSEDNRIKARAHSYLSRTIAAVRKNTPADLDKNVIAYETQEGVDRVLSAVSGWDAHYDGFALTELSKSCHRIIHKPLIVRSQDATGEVFLEPLKQRRQSGSWPWMGFRWNESAGMVAVRTSNQKHETFTVTVYEF